MTKACFLQMRGCFHVISFISFVVFWISLFQQIVYSFSVHMKLKSHFNKSRISFYYNGIILYHFNIKIHACCFLPQDYEILKTSRKKCNKFPLC